MEDGDDIRAEIEILVRRLKDLTPLVDPNMRSERWKVIDRICILETQLDIIENSEVESEEKTS